VRLRDRIRDWLSRRWRVETSPLTAARGRLDHVVILDGTMSSLIPGRETNAGMLYKLLCEARPRARMSLRYEAGIQWRTWSDMRDVIEGRGINRQIRRSYGVIASRYRAGDRIFLFGYSRGAYAVRSLAGMIDRMGLLRAEHATERNIQTIYRYYTAGGGGRGAALFRRKYCHPEVPIEMVGVWDTVKALGLRLPLALGWTEARHAFHNHTLGRSVRHGFHALARDETRLAFAPVLWTRAEDWDGVLEQIWFRGTHGDIGGQLNGYLPARPLANIPLVWMLGKAEGCGLTLPEGWAGRFPTDPAAPSVVPVGTEADAEGRAMLRVFEQRTGLVRMLEAEAPVPDDAVWIDVFEPTADEERRVEAAIGHDVPTRAEMEEIEASSRLYRTPGATYMTATILASSETEEPTGAPVTFILAAGRLVTVRYHDPRPIATFVTSTAHRPQACATGSAALLCLLEAVVDRLADILEAVGRDTERISGELFRRRTGVKPGVLTSTYEDLVRDIGLANVRASKARESLVSLTRLVAFLRVPDDEPDTVERVDTLRQDVRSLLDHTGWLTGTIAFLLDASLGLINIEQNGIIKIFSVMAVVFLPPTLVASIYGMNFAVMPELEWRFGYAWALGLMVVAAVLPYWLFKRKGWL